MEGLLNGDRREQTSLRQRGTDFVVAGDHSSRCQGLDLEWEAARDTHRSGALAAALYVSRHYSDHSLRELGPIGRRDGIRRRNGGDPSIREAIAGRQETREASKPHVKNVAS